MFKKATKSQSKLRCAIFGVSGSGKTFSALRMATGLGNKIAVIDTERGSASKYADRFEFDVVELSTPAIENYVSTIHAAQKENYDVLIIDSLSHGWQELLEQIDKLAKSKFKGNTWSAWSEGTPIQKKLVNAILSFNGHIIATMRSKTEWTLVDTGNDKKKPQRVGLTPEQGKGIEYEFDILMEISQDHIAEIIKDRTGKFQDKIIDKPGEEFGAQLKEWLNDGDPIVDEEAELKKASIIAINNAENIEFLETIYKYSKLNIRNDTYLQEIIEACKKRKAELSGERREDLNKPKLIGEA
jgi:hypothetical protein